MRQFDSQALSLHGVTLFKAQYKTLLKSSTRSSKPHYNYLRPNSWLPALHSKCSSFRPLWLLQHSRLFLFSKQTDTSFAYLAPDAYLLEVVGLSRTPLPTSGGVQCNDVTLSLGTESVCDLWWWGFGMCWRDYHESATTRVKLHFTSIGNGALSFQKKKS